MFFRCKFLLRFRAVQPARVHNVKWTVQLSIRYLQEIDTVPNKHYCGALQPKSFDSLAARLVRNSKSVMILPRLLRICTGGLGYTYTVAHLI